MEEHREKIELEDDAKEKISLMVEHRLPWLAIGLIGGIVATIFSSHFEALLEKNIELAFFIPVIVYMADAVGTQTQTVYVRNLTKRHVKFMTYLIKELLLGLVVGVLFGVGIFLFSLVWFKSVETAFTIALAMFVTMASAPVIALIVPTVIQYEHKDPAVGAGPFTTVIQDLVSLLVYLGIASVILLR